MIESADASRISLPRYPGFMPHKVKGAEEQKFMVAHFANVVLKKSA